MPLLLPEPCEAGFAQRWNVSTNLPSWSTVPARTGNGIQFTLGGVAGPAWSAVRSLAKSSQWTLGLALKLSALPPVGYYLNLFRLLDGSWPQIWLEVNSDGSLSVWRGNRSVLLGTTSSGMLAGVFNFIELQSSIANSGGVFRVRLGEDEILNGTGDTQDTANPFATGIQFGGMGSPAGNLQVTLDDLYIRNDLVYQGDRGVEVYRPNANGTYQEFEPSTPGDHYPLVNEAEPDGDTSYVKTSTPGARESYGFQDMPSNRQVDAVALVLACQKAEGGTRTVKPLWRMGGADYEGNILYPTKLYSQVWQVWEANAPDGAPWTPAKFNAAEPGFKLFS